MRTNLKTHIRELRDIQKTAAKETNLDRILWELAQEPARILKGPFIGSNRNLSRSLHFKYY